MARKTDSWPDAVGEPRAKVVAPAPGDLRIVQALVNTVDLETGKDELASPEALGDWLARWRLDLALLRQPVQGPDLPPP